METKPYAGRSRRGVLVVFEGISGSGKTESIRKLKDDMVQLGYQPKVIEWNGIGFIRKLTNRLQRIGWLTPLSYSILQWLGFAIDYWGRIFPHLRKDGILIADRYVYTGMTRDAVNGSGRLFGRWWRLAARKPDLVFFVDTPPVTCHQRIQARGKVLFRPGKFSGPHFTPQRDAEELDYLFRLRDEYFCLFENVAATRESNVVRIHEETVFRESCIVEEILFGKTRTFGSITVQPENQTKGV